MLKVINKLKAPCAILLLAAGCSYGSLMDAASSNKSNATSVEFDRKIVVSELAKLNEDLIFEKNINQFLSSDLKGLPYNKVGFEKEEESHFLISKKLNRPVGWISFIVRKKEATSIERLGVHKDHRGKGHGTLLINYALQHFRALSVKKVTLEVSSDVVRSMYYKCGFKDSGKNDILELEL